MLWSYTLLKLSKLPEKQADDQPHTECDNTGKWNQHSGKRIAFLCEVPQRIRLTVPTVNCIWHGAALISWASLSIHLGGSLPGVVPLSNPGTHGPVATATDVVARLAAVPGGTNRRRERVQTCCCALNTGPIGLLVMGFPTNGSLWQVASPFSSSLASLRFKAFLAAPCSVKMILRSCLYQCWTSFCLYRTKITTYSELAQVILPSAHKWYYCTTVLGVCHTFIHWWRWLPCKVSISTLGAVWVSVSCPRTLWHADQRIWTSNLSLSCSLVMARHQWMTFALSKLKYIFNTIYIKNLQFIVVWCQSLFWKTRQSSWEWWQVSILYSKGNCTDLILLFQTFSRHLQGRVCLKNSQIYRGRSFWISKRQFNSMFLDIPAG